MRPILQLAIGCAFITVSLIVGFVIGVQIGEGNHPKPCIILYQTPDNNIACILDDKKGRWVLG